MAERENSVWGKIRVQLGDVQNFLLNGQYKEAVILDKENFGQSGTDAD